MAGTTPLALSAAGVWQLAAARRRGAALHGVAEVLGQDPDTPAGERAAWSRLAAAWQGLAPEGAGWATAMGRALPGADAATVAWLCDAEAAAADAAALQAWSDDLRSREETRRGRHLAFIWPLTMVGCMLALWLLAAWYVMPAYAEMWQDISADLPEPTLWTIAFADFTRRHSLVLLVGLSLAALLLWRTRARWRPAVRAAAERIPFVQRVAAARFADRLLVLLQGHAGSRPLQAAALAHLAATATTRPWADCAARLRAALDGGTALSAALLAEPALPRRLGLHVQLGEQRGDVAEVLAQLRAQNAADGHVWVARFERDSLLLAYGVLGVAAWLLVSAIYLPIFKLGTVF